jgi:hypothetical protein
LKKMQLDTSALSLSFGDLLLAGLLLRLART